VAVEAVEQAHSMNGRGLDVDPQSLSIDGAGLGDERACLPEAAPALHVDEEGLQGARIVAARLRGGPLVEGRGPPGVVSGPPR